MIEEKEATKATFPEVSHFLDEADATSETDFSEDIDARDKIPLIEIFAEKANTESKEDLTADKGALINTETAPCTETADMTDVDPEKITDAEIKKVREFLEGCGISERLSDEALEEASKGALEEASKGVSDEVSEEASDEAYDEASEETSAEALRETSEETDSNVTAEETLSDDEFSRILQNPMFAYFARGRLGNIEDTARDFEKMLRAGKNSVSEEDRIRMTPYSGYGAVCDIALSDRQRKIAREAGMAYREYYELIRTLPLKSK